jgi:hypothetical protein
MNVKVINNEVFAQVILIQRAKRLNNLYINHKKSRGKECIHVTIFNINLALVKNKTNMADLTTLK